MKQPGVHFSIVEAGALSMKFILQKSNPLQKIGSGNPDILETGRSEGGVSAVQTINSSASYALRTTKVFILVSQPVTCKDEYLDTHVSSPTPPPPS